MGQADDADVWISEEEERVLGLCSDILLLNSGGRQCKKKKEEKKTTHNHMAKSIRQATSISLHCSTNEFHGGCRCVRASQNAVA